MREIAVFGGSAHPALTAEICAHLNVPQRPVLLKRFANDCLEVQLQSNCRERDVFVIQPLVKPVQEKPGRAAADGGRGPGRVGGAGDGGDTALRVRQVGQEGRAADLDRTAGWSPTCWSRQA